MDEKQKVLARSSGLHAVAFFPRADIMRHRCAYFEWPTSSLRLAGFHLTPRDVQRTCSGDKGGCAHTQAATRAASTGATLIKARVAKASSAEPAPKVPCRDCLNKIPRWTARASRGKPRKGRAFPARAPSLCEACKGRACRCASLVAMQRKRACLPRPPS